MCIVFYLVFVVIKYSLSVASFTPVGLSTTGSTPDWFFGNAITSLILVDPINIAHNLSNPNAKPACGGQPILNAFNKWPNNCWKFEICKISSKCIAAMQDHVFFLNHHQLQLHL